MRKCMVIILSTILILTSLVGCGISSSGYDERITILENKISALEKELNTESDNKPAESTNFENNPNRK